MILVFFFCFIILVIFMILIFTIISTIRISINEFETTNLTTAKLRYQLKISFYIFNKIKWFSFKLNNRKINKIFRKMHLDNLDIKQLEKDIRLSDVDEILKIKPKISYMNLDLKLGIDDVILTTYLVPIVSTIIAIILPYMSKKSDINSIYYKIEPIYNMKNKYYIKLNIVLNIKIVNLLNCIYKIYRNKKFDKRTNKIQFNV